MNETIQNIDNPAFFVENDANYEVLGHREKLTYSEFYRVLFYSLSSLHRQGKRFEAIEMFYDTIGDFSPLFDEIFIKNYNTPIEKGLSITDTYRIHRAHLISLLQRAGIIELPDTRFITNPNWDVPKDVSDVVKTEFDELKREFEKEKEGMGV